MALITLDNPIAWVHFRLRGGWKNVLSTSSAFTVIIVGLIMLSLRDSNGSGSALFFWTQGLIGLQLGIVVLFAASAIRNSVRKDLTTRMIDSHRLMPVPAAQAIPGLIVGSTVQFVSMSAITFVIGMFTSMGATLPVQNWFLANMIVAIFGFSLWFAASLFAFLPTAGFGVLGLAVAGSLMSGGMVLTILPGLGVLVGPLIGRSVFGIVERGGEWSWVYQVSAAAQLSAAALCYLAAVRKWQREDQLAFTPVLGLLLLAGWVLLSGIGIRYKSEFDTHLFGRIPYEYELRVLGSLISAYLLALVPISSAAWQQREWHRRRQLNDISLTARPASIPFVLIMAVIIILLLPLGTGVNAYLRTPPDDLAAIVLSAGFFLVASSYLFRILYRVTARTLLPVLIFLFLSWCLPVLIDWGRYVAANQFDEDVLTWIGACSPVGLLYAICQEEEVPFWPGLMVQAGWPVLMGILFSASRRRKKVTPTSAL